MAALLDDIAYAKALVEFQPRPIRDEAENERSTKLLMAIDEIENPTPEQEAVAEVLITLIEAFEEQHYPEVGASSTPLSRLLHLMDANDMKQKDIVPFIGSKGVTSEVLSGKRAISKTMAAHLGKRFNVPHTLFL